MSKNSTPLWREAHLQVKMYKIPQQRTTFGSSDVEKWHAAVARSTFASQNVQNTPAPDHFLKFRCRKIARGCGPKHIFKSKCTKHISIGPFLEGGMCKNGTPLWREAHLQVKMRKTHQRRNAFGSSDVEKWHAAVARRTFASQNVQNTSARSTFGSLDIANFRAAVARRTFASQNVKNMTCSDHFLKCGHCGAKHIDKSKCKNTLRFAPLLEVALCEFTN